MRWHLRLIALCTVAALAAGCSNSDRPSEPTAPTGTASFADLPPNTACMGDTIWSDTNCNGVQDPGEPGLGGVTVKLYECPSDVLVDETVSEATGYYALFGPAPDDYYIVVTLPSGCTFSPANVGQGGSDDIGTDSDVDAGGVGFCTNLSDQEIEKDMDAGICCPDEPCTAEVGDRVWIDSNCNGIQDSGEAGASGVTVNLYTCGDVFVGTDVTDGSGNYLFTGVEDGSYYVCFTLPSGFVFSPKDQGGVEADDSDANVGGCTDCFTIVDCKDNLFIDAGLCREEVCTADVGDRVWLDLNCDGIQDGGESGVSGVTVTLYTCDDVFVGTDVTDGNGNYLFTGVEDGSYYVCFTLPAGHVFAPKDQGGVEAADSDANVGGCTDCFTIVDCKDNLFVDAGLCREVEGEGCTPGFWKNHLSHWPPTGYSPDQVFDDVFGCDIFGDDTTLYEAASPEITHNTLAAHGVAALLNASHPGVNFGLTVGEVMDAVCDGDKDTLSDANESKCPLSGGNTNKKNGASSQVLK